MTLKLFTYNKYRHSPDAFEKTVQTFLDTSPDVTGFKAFENTHSGDVVFGFELSDTRTVRTEVSVIAWLGMDEVEELTNNLLARIAEQNKQARFVKIIPLSKSPRVMVAVLVESSIESGSYNAGQQDEKKEQNQDTNAGTDAGTKRRRFRRNRKDSEDGTT